MKRAMYDGLAAGGAAFALSLTGCAGAEPVSHIPLGSDSGYANALSTMGVNCAEEMLGSGSINAEVVPTGAGSAVILKAEGKKFTFTGRQEVRSDKASILGAIASGDVKILSWENHDDQGSSAGVRWVDGTPTELLVSSNQGTDASMIIGAACTNNLK